MVRHLLSFSQPDIKKTCSLSLHQLALRARHDFFLMSNDDANTVRGLSTQGLSSCPSRDKGDVIEGMSQLSTFKFIIL